MITLKGFVTYNDQSLRWGKDRIFRCHPILAFEPIRRIPRIFSRYVWFRGKDNFLTLWQNFISTIRKQNWCAYTKMMLVHLSCSKNYDIRNFTTYEIYLKYTVCPKILWTNCFISMYNACNKFVSIDIQNVEL